MRTMRRLLMGGVAALTLVTASRAQTNIAARLDAAIKAANVPIAGVSIGDPTNKATWKVSPSSLQGAAQPTIDAFNVNDTAHEMAELDAAVKFNLDQERLFSAIVWAVVDTYSPPATITKYKTARTKIIDAYKNRPWVP